jgi:hypothetical protein
MREAEPISLRSHSGMEIHPRVNDTRHASTYTASRVELGTK